MFYPCFRFILELLWYQNLKLPYILAFKKKQKKQKNNIQFFYTMAKKINNKQPAHGAATEKPLNTNQHIHNIVKICSLGLNSDYRCLVL